MTKRWSLAEFKPESFEAPHSATEYVEEACAVADVGARTIQDYATAFRRIVGDIMGIRHESRHIEEMEQWLAEVNRISLDKITPQPAMAADRF